MKKSLKLFSLLAISSAMMFTSCKTSLSDSSSSDDSSNGSTPTQETTPSENTSDNTSDDINNDTTDDSSSDESENESEESSKEIHTHLLYEMVEGKEPSHTEDGYKEAYKCVCGKYFEDDHLSTLIGNESDYNTWIKNAGKVVLGPEHTLDNGDFIFNNPSLNSTDISGHWEYKCQCSTCDYVLEQEGTMCRPGNTLYGFNYFKNFSNYETLQKAYKHFFISCEEFLDSTTTYTSSDCISYNGEQYFDIGSMLNDVGVSSTEASRLYSYFRQDTPIYSFIDYLYSYAVDGTNSNRVVSITPLVNYKYFATPALREKAYDAIIDMGTDCKVSGTDYNKVVTITKYICNRINYLYDSNGNASSESYAHSIDGCSQKLGGVCECYAKSFLYLCQINGIDCIVENSDDHAYNFAKINGSWYGFDPTWTDQSWGLYWGYWGKSESNFVSNNSSSNNYHHKYAEPSYNHPTLSTTNLATPN